MPQRSSTPPALWRLRLPWPIAFFNGRLRPPTTKRTCLVAWHSWGGRPGKLIAFSNGEFYEDDLVVFPSPTEGIAGQAMSLVKVNGVHKDRRNDVEAEAVCKAAAIFMREHPDRSLGVATLNMTQNQSYRRLEGAALFAASLAGSRS